MSFQLQYCEIDPLEPFENGTLLVDKETLTFQPDGEDQIAIEIPRASITRVRVRSNLCQIVVHHTDQHYGKITAVLTKEDFDKFRASERASNAAPAGPYDSCSVSVARFPLHQFSDPQDAQRDYEQAKAALESQGVPQEELHHQASAKSASQEEHQNDTQCAPPSEEEPPSPPLTPPPCEATPIEEPQEHLTKRCPDTEQLLANAGAVSQEEPHRLPRRKQQQQQQQRIRSTSPGVLTAKKPKEERTPLPTPECDTLGAMFFKKKKEASPPAPFDISHLDSPPNVTASKKPVSVPEPKVAKKRAPPKKKAEQGAAAPSKKRPREDADDVTPQRTSKLAEPPTKANKTEAQPRPASVALPPSFSLSRTREGCSTFNIAAIATPNLTKDLPPVPVHADEPENKEVLHQLLDGSDPDTFLRKAKMFFVKKKAEERRAQVKAKQATHVASLLEAWQSVIEQTNAASAHDLQCCEDEAAKSIEATRSTFASLRSELAQLGRRIDEAEAAACRGSENHIAAYQLAHELRTQTLLDAASTISDKFNRALQAA